MLHWGVYFIVVSNVFRTLGTVHIGFFTLNQFVIISLFIVTLIINTVQRKNIAIFGPVSKALIAFSLFLWFANFALNPNPDLGMRDCIDYLRSLVCYFLVIMLIDTRKKIRLLVLTLIVASVVMAFTGKLYAMLTSNFVYKSYGMRSGIHGAAEHYIIYAQYSIVSIPLVYFYLKNSNKNFVRIISYAILALLSFATIFSGSRGAILTFFVMTVAIVIQEIRDNEKIGTRKSSYFLFSFLALFIFSLFWIKGGSGLVDSLLTIFSDKEITDSSLSGRLFLMKASFRLFLDNPFIGSGLNSVMNLYGLKPHSQWLQILTELGIVGLLFAMAIVFNLFHESSIAGRNVCIANDGFTMEIISAVRVSIFSILFWGFYENVGLLQADKILFMLFGLSVSISRYANTERSPKLESQSGEKTSYLSSQVPLK